MRKNEDIKKKRAWAHEKLLELNALVYQAYLETEQTTFAEGALTKKTKELIAIGISVVIDCESCMQWHVEQAAKAGASHEEILEALEVGMEMGGGPVTAAERFALEVLDEVH